MPQSSKGALRVLAWPPGSSDDLNPYVRLMYSAFTPPAATIIPYSPLMPRVPAADVFHVQWPEAIFEGQGGDLRVAVWAKTRRILRTARRIRAAGGVVALTAHNLAPHADLDGWRADIWAGFHSAFLHEVDLLVGLSEGGLNQFVQLHPQVSGAIRCVIPHPHYRSVYPHVPQAEARRGWSLPDGATVIGMLGSLRPGKGVRAAIEAFRGNDDVDQRLLIAGGCDDAHWQAILHSAADDARIILRRGQLSDDDMAEAVAAIDIMLINQQGTLNSGSALMALSLDRKVLAPDVGGLPELRAFAGDSHLAMFQPPLSPQALRSGIADLVRSGPSRCAALDALDPVALSRRLLEAMSGALATRRRSAEQPRS